MRLPTRFRFFQLAHVTLLVAAWPPSIVSAVPDDYSLVFSDEFEGATLDATKWHTGYAPEVHPEGTNGEKQVYLPERVSLREGHLHLTAIPRGEKFASGLISSHDHHSQQYGWFEARVHLPKGKGIWPAFWLLPDDKKTWPPEIDIFETRGSLPNEVVFTLHEPQEGTWRPKSTGKTWNTQDLTTGFHTFALEWTPHSLKWFVDGVERHRYPHPPPATPMYVILNLAIGGAFDGDPDQTTRFPAEMVIDYVRVYSKAPATNQNGSE